MVFRFLILSDEVDDFKREIKIDSEATFLDLYNAIMDSVGYTKDQMCSFFICDDDWSKNTEITLVEMKIHVWKSFLKTSIRSCFSSSII